ncbi:MAG: hypothetical protein WKG01_00315 [Kofleriaceae bacterium]
MTRSPPLAAAIRAATAAAGSTMCSTRGAAAASSAGITLVSGSCGQNRAGMCCRMTRGLARAGLKIDV